MEEYSFLDNWPFSDLKHFFVDLLSHKQLATLDLTLSEELLSSSKKATYFSIKEKQLKEL